MFPLPQNKAAGGSPSRITGSGLIRRMRKGFFARSSVGRAARPQWGRESDWRPARKLWSYTAAGSGLSRHEVADLRFTSQSQTRIAGLPHGLPPQRKLTNKRKGLQLDKEVPKPCNLNYD